MTALRILDIGSDADFRRIPPCADPRFDHRTCDHWEDADRGSRDHRPGWLTAAPAAQPSRRAVAADNPFAPPPKDAGWNPFTDAAAAPRRSAFDPFADDEQPDAAPAANPFAPARTVERGRTDGVPRKLALLDRGRGIFGSYAKVLLDGEEAIAFAQFGPLSAYPRALRIRDLYPKLPSSPLPAVITCIATTAGGRGHGHAQRLVAAVCDDLAGRGFAAVETYPDRTQAQDATSAATPRFWETCGFHLAVEDARFPVMRRELG